MESRFKYKYGVLGAGTVSASLIGHLKSRELGPVSAVSFRVASRIANTLRAGYPVRNADELDDVPCVLFHAPPDQLEILLEMLESAQIDWAGKALVFCDCIVDPETRKRFKARGAGIAVARQFGIPGHLIVEAEPGSAGSARALKVVNRIAREVRMKAIEIAPGSADLVDAAVTLGSAAITPLIDQAAGLLRAAGVRDIEASRIASSLFEQTARDYAHSGQQSWVWYVRKPAVASLRAQIAAIAAPLQPTLLLLLLFGFETFRKHEEVCSELRANSPKIP